MIINKSLVGISFGEDTSLNIVMQDLLDTMLSFSFEGENFNEIAGAGETITTPEFYARTSTTIHLRSDSPKYEVYQKRLISNARAKGSATLTFDNGINWTLRNIVIKMGGEYTADGRSADGAFTITADVRLNSDLLV